jgi:hypothetical protein
MATYASADDLRAYIEDDPLVVVPDDEAIERLLERAEHDVNRVCSVPLGFDLDALSEAQAAALSRATCAQAEFRLAMSEYELVGADDNVSSVAGVVSFSTRPIPRVGVKCLEELAGHDLLRYSGTVEDAAP